MTDKRPFRGILYVMDSLRYDRVGCNGYAADVTPTIDSLADDGISFDHAFSQAIWTYPSAGSIFTGLYPETHDSQQFDRGISPQHPHIADAFVGEDVATACFSSTLGVSPERGFEQSFDEFYHLGDEDAGLRPDITDVLTDRVTAWLEARGEDEGFFIVVWSMGTHHPFLTPEDDVVDDPSKPLKNVAGIEGTQDWMRRLPEERLAEVRERYDAAVEYNDRRLGNIVETLRNKGIYGDTTLVVTADHGELFDEHARLEHGETTLDRLAEAVLPAGKRRYFSLFERSAFVGHQAIYPYDELIHVPFVVKPGEASALEAVPEDGFVELVDILPTLWDLAGVPVPDAVQGTSILRQVEGESKQYVYSASQIHGGNVVYRSVRDDGHKLCTKGLVDFEPSLIFDSRAMESVVLYLLGKRRVLFELPEEMPASDQQASDSLARTLESHVEACRSAADSHVGARIDIDDATTEHLENLGYK